MTAVARPARVSHPLLAACGYFLPRLLFLQSRFAPQVHWGDIATALDGFPCDNVDLASSAFWLEWRDRWLALAEEYVHIADGSTTTAGQARAHRSAAACYHWAEFMYFDDAALKLELRKRVRDCFERSLDGSALGISCHAFKDELGVDVPYWVIEPPTHARMSQPWPCVILSNGLDSMTEVEILALAETYLERGMAAVLFEGPGQGISVGQIPLRLDMESIAERIARRIGEDPRIDGDRLAFVGVSFGGYLALRVAQKAPAAFTCVVNLSGGPRIKRFEHLPRRLKDDFLFALMASGPEAVQATFDELAIDPWSPAGTGVLTIHGALDDIFPLEDVKTLDEAWGDRHELVVHEREAHVCLNKINAVSIYAADWVAGQLC